MPIVVDVPNRGSIELPDGTPDEEIDAIVSKEFPPTGEDIAGALASDPSYRLNDEQFALFEEYSKNKQTDWVGTMAQAAEGMLSTIGSAAEAGVTEGAALNPLNLVEGFAQGTRSLVEMAAYSQSPDSPLFKFKNLIAGDGTLEDRRRQFNEARDFAEKSQKVSEEGGLLVPKELTNPDFVRGVSLIADPTLFIPGFGEVFGISKLATKSVGKAAQIAGKTVSAVARPVEVASKAAERLAASAIGVSPEAAANVARATGVTSALGITPAVGMVGAIPTAAAAAGELGAALEAAGKNLVTQPSRIGPLEAIGRLPEANLRQRAIGAVGRYGGDVALDASLKSVSGAATGAAFGGGLGYLSGGEEGAAAGVGSGLALGAAGSMLGQAYGKLSGKDAIAARKGDFDRYVSTQDEKTAGLLRRIESNNGLDVASGFMDATAMLRGKLGDIEVRLLPNSEFVEKFGGGRGVQVPEAGSPVAYVNADIFGKGRGDNPLYTLGHEMFHALESAEQLSDAASRIKQDLVGTWSPDNTGEMRKVSEGLMPEADVERMFSQYRDKLPPSQADNLSQYDTVQKRANYIASEIAAEHLGRLVSGQKPDAMLRGFTGLSRQLLDAALLRNSDSALSRMASRIEGAFGVKPVDSVVFPELKQASPMLNAMLRDLIRSRGNLDERIELADISGNPTVLRPRDVANPVAAERMVDLGLAERNADGSVRVLADDEIAVREQNDTAELRRIVSSIPGAREVDGTISGRFSPEQLSAIEQSQRVSSRMRDKIRAVGAAMRNGNSIFIDYGAATRRAQNRLTGKYYSRYSSGIRLSQREVLPYSFYLSKADNPVIKVIDITKMRRALQDITGRDGSVGGLWSGPDAFLSDLARYFTNLDSGEARRPSRELFGDERAKYIGDFVNGQEKGERKFVRDIRIDRIGSTDPRDFRARISEEAIQESKRRWMPSENVGDTRITNSEEGYRIVSGAKHRLYGPDGKLIGIFDTQAKAERKADATQTRIQSEVDQLQRPARDEGRQAAEAGGRNRPVGSAEGGTEGRQVDQAVRQAGDVNAQFEAASEADPTQPSTQAIRTVKGQRAVNSLYQFDYTYKVQRPGKPSKEVTATETVSAFSLTEARDKAKKAIQKELQDKTGVLRSTVSISQPTIKGQFAVTELTGKNRDKTVPKIVLNPNNAQQFRSMFDAVDAALELVKYSPTLGLDSDGWIRAFSRSMNGSRASVPPAPLRLAEWAKNNDAFKTFIMDGLQRNPELVKSAVGGLNALQPIHEMARAGMIHPKMVALHMFWGLLSRMLDPYNQEAGWARLTSDPKVNRLIEESVAGRYKSSKDEWKAIVDAKMSEFPDVKVGRNAIQNANAFHEMLSRWNGRWNELTDIINDPNLSGPQMRRKFNEQGFGGAGIKHKVLSFVIATLARNDVFVGDRWQVVNLWFPHLEKSVAARKSSGGSGDVFAYDKNGVPEDTTGAYKVIGGMLNNETVAETAYSLIENGMSKIASESPWLREMLGRDPQPFDIHWLTWNIIKNEPVGHSSLDATAKFLTENLYGDPEFAKKFAETEKRTEKYTKGAFDVFSVKGQERPQISQRPGASYGGSGAPDLRTYEGWGPGRPSRPESARYLPAERSQEDAGRRVPSSRFGIDPATRGTEFADAIRRTKAEHPFGFAVDDKGNEFYTAPGTQLFLSEDGLAGVAVTDYGDLVSVFKHPESTSDIKPLLVEAASKSQTLDAFDVNGFLPNLYGNLGFRPVARVPFNREYAPPGWRYDLAGEPDVVLMVNDPSGTSGSPQITGKNYSEVKAKVPAVDYDTAVRMQQEAKQRIAESKQGQPQSAEIAGARLMPSDREVTRSVNINDSSQDFTGQILRGEKTIETRDTLNNALQGVLGQRIGITRTGTGDTKVVGYATVAKQPIVYQNESEFRRDEGRHRVSSGSPYDIKKGGVKYGYELTDVVAVDPFAPKSVGRKYSMIEAQKFMPQPDPSVPGAYMVTGGFRIIPGASAGRLRIYGPAGNLVGVVASLEEAMKVVRRKQKLATN